MLKEKWEITKTFCMEHKKEIITGAVVITGAIIGYTVCKKSGIMKKAKTMKSEQTSITDKYVDLYNKASEIANETLIPEINKKYEQYDFSNIENDPAMKLIYDQYIEEYESKFSELMDSLR